MRVRQLTSRALALLVLGAGAARAQVAPSEYAQRRDSLMARLKDGVLVAIGGREPEEDYLSFYQREPFYYLTGVKEPNAALVVVKRGGATAATLFVEPRLPAREVWTGRRMGPAGATQRTGLPARPIEELRGVLDSLAAAGLPFSVVSGDGAGAQALRAVRQARPQLAVSEDASRYLMQLRARKSPAELALIRKAVEITVLAQRDAIRTVKPGLNEFEVQALIEYDFRRNGADRPSFSSIVGSGPNSTTLHYNADDRFMNAGEVVVMDIGASYKGYAADVTRTVPVGGTFTPAQREIYQVVRDAQAAAERQATLGAPAHLMEDSASATLAAGLARLGLIEAPDARYECGARGQLCSQLSLYYMHAIGHGIGLEVHDPDQYYFTGTIAPGSAFTIEPGIYVREELLDIIPDTPRNRAFLTKLRPALERYRNVGVRIEDDYVATDSGVEWISRAPRELAEVEALMKEQFAGPGPRDAKLVESYRESPPR